MRVDRLRIQNFKGFEDYTLELHPRFTVLVGDNGAGKTTILDALAVAAGIWLVKPPDSMLANSGRNILRNEIRLHIRHEGDRPQFVECKPVSISAKGEIAGHQLDWLRQIRLHGCTSHSPFIIQSLEAGELRTLDPGGPQLLRTAHRHQVGAGRCVSGNRGIVLR